MQTAAHDWGCPGVTSVFSLHLFPSFMHSITPDYFLFSEYSTLLLGPSCHCLFLGFTLFNFICPYIQILKVFLQTHSTSFNFSPSLPLHCSDPALPSTQRKQLLLPRIPYSLSKLNACQDYEGLWDEGYSMTFV